MYGLPDTLRPLSAAEEQVMLAVWACPGRGGAAGHQPEAQGHRLGSSHGAELSLPVGGKRLGQVGKTGNCNVYVPLVTRRAYGVYCMRQRLDTLFDGDLAAAVHALVREWLLPERLGAGIRCWRRSIRRRRSTICTTPMAELFHIFLQNVG